jgi:hypothetical protein
MHRLLVYPQTKAIKRNLTVRVPQDFSTIQRAIDYFRGVTCVGCGINIAPGTYDEYLIVKNIQAVGEPPYSADMTTTGSLGNPIGALGSHGLELRMVGYADNVVPGVIIGGIISYINDLGLYGIRAIMTRASPVAPSVSYGFMAYQKGRISCYDCQAINGNAASSPPINSVIGFSAVEQGIIKATRAIARNCNIGFYSLNLSSLVANDSISENNRSWQYLAQDNSSLRAVRGRAVGFNGFGSYYNSTVYAQDTIQVGTGTSNTNGYGYYAQNATILADRAFGDFNFVDFYSDLNSFISATSSKSLRSYYAYLSYNRSLIQCDGAAAGTSQIGFTAQNSAVLFAYNTTQKLSGNTTNYSPTPSGTIGNGDSVVFYS